EVGSITKVGNQTQTAKGQGPNASFRQVQEKHQENRSGKDEDSQAEMPVFLPQHLGLPPVTRNDTVQSDAMDNGNDDQHHAAKHQSINRNQLRLNVRQQCRNKLHTHPSTSEICSGLSPLNSLARDAVTMPDTSMIGGGKELSAGSTLLRASSSCLTCG